MTVAVAATVAVAVVAGLTASQITARNQLRVETDRFLLERVVNSVHQEPFGKHYSDDRPGEEESPLFEFDAVTQYIDANGKVVGSIAGQPALPIDDHDLALAKNPGSARLARCHRRRHALPDRHCVASQRRCGTSGARHERGRRRRGCAPQPCAAHRPHRDAAGSGRGVGPRAPDGAPGRAADPRVGVRREHARPRRPHSRSSATTRSAGSPPASTRCSSRSRPRANSRSGSSPTPATSCGHRSPRCVRISISSSARTTWIRTNAGPSSRRRNSSCGS